MSVPGGQSEVQGSLPQSAPSPPSRDRPSSHRGPAPRPGEGRPAALESAT